MSDVGQTLHPSSDSSEYPLHIYGDVMVMQSSVSLLIERTWL